MAARFAFDQRARDVDATGGEEFLLRREIQRGKGEAASRAGACYDLACKRKGPAEEARRMCDAAGSDLTPDDAAGNYFAVTDDRRDNDNFESAAGSELAEAVHVARLLMPKTEIFS